MSRTKSRRPGASRPAQAAVRLSSHAPGQRITAKYDAAQTTRHNESHWANADALSANAANSPEVRAKIRNRARYEVANNSYAAGMVRTLADDTIGTGPTLQIDAGPREVNFRVELAFWRWMVAAQFIEKLRTMRMARSVDGESFGCFHTNPQVRSPVKLDVRVYEAEQVAAPMLRLEPSLTDGIILDDFGNVAGYSVLKAHPGGATLMSAIGESEVIPARDMMHLFLATRAGQNRGVSEITPSLPLFAQLRHFTLAVIAAADAAADVAGVIRSNSTAIDPANVDPLDVFELEKRMFMTMPHGWDITQLKAEQPATTYEMFKREILNEAARCIGMPYNVAAGNSSRYNYASGRLDHKTYFKLIRVDRSRLELYALDPTFERWWEEARLIPGLLPDELRGLPEAPEHGWRWDGDEHVDPKKEADAQKVRLDSHTTTLAFEYGRQGLDWETQLRQRGRELDLIEALNLNRFAPVGGAPPVEEEEEEEEVADAA